MSDTALLVIDVQVGFFDSNPAVYKGEEILPRIKKLIEKARAANIPVVYVRHDEDPEEFREIHPQIAPQEGEPVISKMTPDSFYETNLQETLTELGVKNLVIAGFATEYCIDTTTRSAFGKKYKVTVVKDSHSTFDNPVIDAPTIIAHHNNVLQGFARLVTAQDVDFTQ